MPLAEVEETQRSIGTKSEEQGDSTGMNYLNAGNE
jgi:hypothetical protein